MRGPVLSSEAGNQGDPSEERARWHKWSRQRSGPTLLRTSTRRLPGCPRAADAADRAARRDRAGHARCSGACARSRIRPRPQRSPAHRETTPMEAPPTERLRPQRSCQWSHQKLEGAGRVLAASLCRIRGESLAPQEGLRAGVGWLAARTHRTQGQRQNQPARTQVPARGHSSDSLLPGS